MALKPGNEVVGGNTLMRQAIQSPNFVTGVSGWSINQDGSAEFNNVVIRNGQVVSGTALFYSGPPAAGNLVASVSAAAGTDSHGNAYLAGFATYNTATINATQLLGGLVTFYSAASEAGPWNALGQLSDGLWLEPAASGLLFKVGAVPAQLQLATALVTATVATAITAAVAGGTVLTVTNSTGGGGNALIAVTAQSLGDQWASMRVAGDTVSRLVFETTAGGITRLRLGSGAAATDITVQRAAANLLSVLTADLAVATLGRGLQVKEGANAKQGTAVLNGGAPASVVVANTSVTATSRILVFNNALAGVAVPPSYAISARTPGTSFTILSSANGDTSTVAYEIFEGA